jgi:hypothetical protein
MDKKAESPIPKRTDVQGERGPAQQKVDPKFVKGTIEPPTKK